MAVGEQFRKYAAKRATRKLIRAVPWLGAAVALVMLGSAIRRKGWVRGAAHTALDFTPVLGTVKNLTELGLGRDLFRDRPVPASRVEEIPDNQNRRTRNLEPQRHHQAR